MNVQQDGGGGLQKEEQTSSKGRMKGMTDQKKVVSGRAMLEPKKKRKISNNDLAFIYSFRILFIMDLR